MELVDKKWIDEFFDAKVGKRGAEIIAARKLSSAASAAQSAIQHMRNLIFGSNDWQSMGVMSDGSYGVPKDLIFSYPVHCMGDGTYKIIQGLTISEYYQKKIDKTTQELLQEKELVQSLLK